MQLYERKSSKSKTHYYKKHQLISPNYTFHRSPEKKKNFANNVSSHRISAFVFETTFIRRTSGLNQDTRRNDIVLENHVPNSVRLLFLPRLSLAFTIPLLFLNLSSLQTVNIVYFNFI